MSGFVADCYRIVVLTAAAVTAGGLVAGGWVAAASLLSIVASVVRRAGHKTR